MRWLSLMLVTASVSACAGDSPTAPARSPAASMAAQLAGSYGLATMNGHTLPQVLGYDGIGTAELLSGAIKLSDDATYFDILTFRRRGPSGIMIEVDTVRGTFMQFAHTLMLQPSSGGAMSFFDIRDANTLAAADPGFYLIYRR